MTETLKATHRIYHLEISEDGDSSAPYGQATGQAGADQQVTPCNLFLRRSRFGNGSSSSRGASRSVRTYQNNGQGCHAFGSGRGAGERQHRHGREGMPSRIPTGRGDGGPAPGGFFSPTWFSPLGLEEGLLSIGFPSKLFFPLKSSPPPPFCFIFPLWKFDLRIRLLASGLSLKMSLMAIPFLWAPKSILMVVVVGFSHLDAGS